MGRFKLGMFTPSTRDYICPSLSTNPNYQGSNNIDSPYSIVKHVDSICPSILSNPDSLFLEPNLFDSFPPPTQNSSLIDRRITLEVDSQCLSKQNSLEESKPKNQSVQFKKKSSELSSKRKKNNGLPKNFFYDWKLQEGRGYDDVDIEDIEGYFVWKLPKKIIQC